MLLLLKNKNKNSGCLILLFVFGWYKNDEYRYKNKFIQTWYYDSYLADH